jgi:hypothetical protein
MGNRSEPRGNVLTDNRDAVEAGHGTSGTAAESTSSARNWRRTTHPHARAPRQTRTGGPGGALWPHSTSDEAGDPPTAVHATAIASGAFWTERRLPSWRCTRNWGGEEGMRLVLMCARNGANSWSQKTREGGWGHDGVVFAVRLRRKRWQLGPTWQRHRDEGVWSRSGWLAGPARRCLVERGARARRPLLGRAGVKKGSGPNSWKLAQIGFLLLFLLFSFLSLFKFKLYSNLIQTLVTNYSQMKLRQNRATLMIYILLLYLFSFGFNFRISFLLFQTLEFLLGFNFPLEY